MTSPGPLTVAENRLFFVGETKDIKRRPSGRGLSFIMSADTESISAALPAPDKPRYKAGLQWIPVLSAASFWVFGR